jgi:hypothetical protein
MTAMNVAPLRPSRDLLDDPEALARRAYDDGYLYLPWLVPHDAVAALRDVALAVAADLGWLATDAPRAAGIAVPGLALGGHDDPRWVRFLTQVLPHSACTALRDQPALRHVVEVLLGGPAGASAGDLCRVVSGDNPAHTTPPHQERYYVRGDGALWIAWLPLTECPLALGPLAILPRSHEGGLLPHATDHGRHPGVHVRDDVVWLASDLAPGDAVLFSGLTVHRALPHQCGPRLRLSADFRFQRGSQRAPTT